MYASHAVILTIGLALVSGAAALAAESSPAGGTKASGTPAGPQGKYLTLRPRPVDQANFADGASNALTRGEQPSTLPSAGGGNPTPTAQGGGLTDGDHRSGLIVPAIQTLREACTESCQKRTAQSSSNQGNAVNGASNSLMVGEMPPSAAGDSFYGTGVYKSTDSGKTWSLSGVTGVDQVLTGRRGGNGGPQIANPGGNGSKLPAIQRIRERDLCAPNCTQRTLEPGLANIGGGANASTQPPPPPPPPPPTSSPLPVLMVLPNLDLGKPGGDKGLSAPVVNPGKAPIVSNSMGANQTLTIGGARTR